jgi:UDP-N-acetyl-D-mannosaminuronic acid dehydrogenase
MSAESYLLNRIRLRQTNLAVLGLGHVGLPTALVFARAGFNVTGIDTDAHKVETLRLGRCYIREPGLEELLAECLANGTFRVTADGVDPLRTSDVVIICVPTPVENAAPDLRSFMTAFGAVKASIHERMMILIESTLPVSTTSRFVAPQLKSLGHQIDEDIFLAYCPERIAPGSALEELVSNPRIVGGIGPRSGETAAELYKTVCKHVVISDCLTAELTKLAENTFRDINIAYANLVALIAEQFGADANEVISLANTHPRVRIHAPGLGVGGPCLPKDPLILTHAVPEDVGQFVRFGRKLNDGMVGHAVDRVTRTLISNGVDIRYAKVAVLGLSYKAESDDTTNSPAKPLIEELLRRKASVVAYDPYTTVSYGAKRAPTIEDALRDSDCVIIVVAHSVFRSLDPSEIAQLTKKNCVIFDGPRVLEAARINAKGLTYLGTGYGCDQSGH